MKMILAGLAILSMVSLTQASTFDANFNPGDTGPSGGVTSLISDTPEPTSFALMGVGALVLVAARRRKV